MVGILFVIFVVCFFFKALLGHFKLMRRAYAVCDGCEGGRISNVRAAADGGGHKRKCVGKRMDNADEERSVGRRKGRVSRRRGECR